MRMKGGHRDKKKKKKTRQNFWNQLKYVLN